MVFYAIVVFRKKTWLLNIIQSFQNHCRLKVLNLIQELEVPNQYGEGFINRYLMKPGQSSGGGRVRERFLYFKSLYIHLETLAIIFNNLLKFTEVCEKMHKFSFSSVHFYYFLHGWQAYNILLWNLFFSLKYQTGSVCVII